MDILAPQLRKLRESNGDKNTLARVAQEMFGLVPDVIDEKAALALLIEAADPTPARLVRSTWNKIKARKHAVPDSVPDDISVTVLVPGAHFERENEWKIVTPQDFGNAIIAAQSHLYRRSDVVGIMDATARKFRALTVPTIRVGIATRPYAWKQSKETGLRERVYVPFNADLASLALARAETHPSVREIKYVVQCPVLLPNGKWSEQGYNEGGVWMFGDGDKYKNDPERAAKPDLAVWDDLFIDFPWMSEADRQNAISFIVTAVIRPYIIGCCPFFGVTSTTERTGKTKFIDTVAGGIVLGGPVPPMQFTGSEEEKDKRISASLIEGHQLIHLDNISKHMDSGALASLGTALVYCGRMLGQSKMITLPNSALWCFSGNNISMSGELAKRSVPIRLWPPMGAPHLRKDFKHPNLAAYVKQVRFKVLATIRKMVDDWMAAGCPPGTIPMGGFDEWARIVGGIMQHAGFTEWMTNYAVWTEKTDPEGTDFVRFLEDWIERGATESKPSELCDRAVELGLFERTLGRASNEKGQHTAFASILRRYLNRVVTTLDGDVTVTETFDRKGRRYLPMRSDAPGGGKPTRFGAGSAVGSATQGEFL